MHRDDSDSPPPTTAVREPAPKGEYDEQADPLQHLRRPPEARDPEAEDRAEVQRMWQQAGKFGFIGIEFGVATAIGYFIGRWLDVKFGTGPWLSMTFALCGVAAASIDLVRMVRRAQREEAQREQRNHPDV